MKKYILTKLLMIAVFIFTAEMSVAAAARAAEDEDLSHLPKRLQQPAKEFYEAIEGYYRHAIEAEEDGGSEAGSIGVRPEEISFYDHYCPAEPGGLRANRARFLSEPIMAFVDWIIFSDGIGVGEDEEIAATAEGIMINLTNPAFAIPEDSREPAKTIELLACLEPLGANPYAQHLRGVFLYCGVGGEPNRDAGYRLIYEAARNNYIRALRFLNTIIPFDESNKEQKRLKWALEDLEDPKEFIIEFIRRRNSSLDKVEANLFERFEKVIKYCCPGDNEKLWDLYESSIPKIYDIFKEEQGSWDFRGLRDLAVVGSALGLSIAWIPEGGMEPILSTTVAAVTLAASGVYYIWTGNFYRTMSWITCGSERFRESAPMNLSSGILEKEAKLASLFSVIYFSEKFQGPFPKSIDSLTHQIRLIFDREGALSGTKSLSKMIFSERGGMFS